MTSVMLALQLYSNFEKKFNNLQVLCQNKLSLLFIRLFDVANFKNFVQLIRIIVYYYIFNIYKLSLLHEYSYNCIIINMYSIPI